VERLAIAMLASLEGGLLLSRALQDETPLAVALDAAIGHLRTFAVPDDVDDDRSQERPPDRG